MANPLPKQMNYRQRMESGGMGIVEKLVIQPTNGATALAGSGFSEFSIPGSRANTFADLRNLYINFGLVSATTTNSKTYLDVGGVAYTINRIVVDSTSGVQICETQGKHIIDGLKMLETWEYNNFANSGQIIMGTRANTAATTGVEITTAERKFCLPIVNTSINQSNIPMMGNDGIRIRIYWNYARDFLICQNDGAVPLAADLTATFSNIYLHYDSVRLSNADMAGLYNELDGRFVITGTDIYNQSSVMDATALNMNLGVGRSKCKKLYMTNRVSTNFANDDDGILLSSHSYNMSTLTNAALYYNGRIINEQNYTFGADNASVIAAEIIKSKKHSLTNPSLNVNVATGAANLAGSVYNAITGTFYMTWDLTSGLDTVMGESGLDTRTGTFQLQLTASTSPASQVDVFCEYENIIVLDLKGDNVFRVMS